MLHLAVDLVREHEGVEVDLATIPQEPEVYALLTAADTIGVFQVESRAQMATLPRLRPREVLRPGGRGRADPSRSDPGRFGPSLPAASQRRGARHLSPSAARAVPGEDARGAAVPGAAHADGDRRRRLHARGVGPAPPGDGLEAVAGAHGGDARTALRGDGRAGHHRRGGRRHRPQDRGLRRLRLPREPLGELRLSRVLQLVDQAPLPGRVRVRAAQRATDGLLLAAHHRARRHPSRSRGAGPVRRRVTAGLHAGAPHRRRPARSGGPRPGWHADPSIHAMRVGLRVRPRAQRRVARPHRRRARRAAVRRPPGLHPSHRRAHRRARGARHRGCVRVLRPEPPSCVVGRGRAARRPARQAAGRGHRYRRADAAGHDRGGGGRGRPVGDRPVVGAPSHRVPPRASSRRAGSSPPRRCANCPTVRWSTSPAW